jgi:hypothetical protein
MSDLTDETAMSRVVDGYLHPEGKAFVLRFNKPGGQTDYVSFPLEDVSVLADIAALAVRTRLAAVSFEHESELATTFEVGELPGAETVLLNFSRGSQPPMRVALPKSAATRLMQSLQKLLPMIGGARSVN